MGKGDHPHSPIFLLYLVLESKCPSTRAYKRSEEFPLWGKLVLIARGCLRRFGISIKGRAFHE
jgi:hypothetical protein